MNLTTWIKPCGFDLRFFGRTLFAAGARKGPHSARTTDHVGSWTVDQGIASSKRSMRSAG